MAARPNLRSNLSRTKLSPFERVLLALAAMCEIFLVLAYIANGGHL